MRYNKRKRETATLFIHTHIQTKTTGVTFNYL